MTDVAKRPLKVALVLKWKHDDIYDATVSVTILDSWFKSGELHEGLPKGQVGIPEMEYLTFDFSHTSGKACSDLVKPISKTIQHSGQATYPECLSVRYFWAGTFGNLPLVKLYKLQVGCFW